MAKQTSKFFRAPLALKADGPEGAVQAVISTFGVVDKDLDVVLPTAFTDGQQVPMVWSHDWSMPVGRGVIRVQPDRAIFEGRFFLETQAGREAYATCKAMSDLQEWSWGFQVLDSAYETRDGKPIRVIRQAQVFEVSPVLVGAGEGTRTLAIKAALTESKAAIPFKATAKAPEDEPWSAPALKDFTDKSWGDLTDAEKRDIASHFTWSANMPPESYGDLKLPHHRPSDGAVVWNGVANCVARMGQAQIPDADMPAIRAHLRGHYEQFGKDVPDILKGEDGKVLKAADFATTFQQALTAEQLSDARWNIDRAWRISVGSILEDATLDAAAKLALLRTSGAQYLEALVAWAARVLAVAAASTTDVVMYDGLESFDHKGQPYAEQAEAALAAARALVGRSVALAATRQKEGRTLSTANREKLASLLEALNSVAKEISDLLAATEPPKALSPDYLERRLRASALSLARFN